MREIPAGEFITVVVNRDLQIWIRHERRYEVSIDLDAEFRCSLRRCHFLTGEADRKH